jgi:hypothetical protein
MSFQEPGNEAEWITFVSPLVRIVEEGEGEKGKGKEKSEGSGLSSEMKGNETMVEVGGVEMQGEVSASNWDNDDGVHEDLFESLMDFGPISRIG